MMNDTIAAIATPLADGAISIIRISGEDAVAIANTLFDQDLEKYSANTINYGYIIDPKTKEPVDEVLVSLFRAPKSFTAEDVVEINCHGGSFITKMILTLVLGAGARMALPGEFTQRAFLHGRIDLTQAEAVLDMIEANDKNKARMALKGIRGSVAKLLEPLINELLDMIAHVEVNIDYPEYDDVEQIRHELLLPQTEAWLTRIEEMIKSSESGIIMKTGIKTAIVGKPNVGKSSLLNALLEEEKAIVTDVEGTTRDTVEGSVRLGEVTLNLIDTAGIRDSDDVIEQIGIEKSKAAIEAAQLVLVVLDGGEPLDDRDRALLTMTGDKERLIVYNKSDLMGDAHLEGICISAKNHDLCELLAALSRRYESQSNTWSEPTLQNERQIGLMRTAYQQMENARAALAEGIPIDLVQIDMQAAYQSLKEILGEYHRDDLLDTLFSHFCLGK